MTLKLCTKCGEEIQKLSPNRAQCKKCIRAVKRAWELTNPEKRAATSRKRTLSVYNLTPEQYEAILESQGNVCKICHKKTSDGRALQVDHDHKCCPGKKSCGRCIRGLVCGGCNVRLGWLENYAEEIRSYLQDTSPLVAGEALGRERGIGNLS